jgi:hypothetical protein
MVDRKVSEVLTDETLLKKQSLLAQNDIEAVVVLGKQPNFSPRDGLTPRG